MLLIWPEVPLTHPDFCTQHILETVQPAATRRLLPALASHYVNVLPAQHSANGVLTVALCLSIRLSAERIELVLSHMLLSVHLTVCRKETRVSPRTRVILSREFFPNSGLKASIVVKRCGPTTVACWSRALIVQTARSTIGRDAERRAVHLCQMSLTTLECGSTNSWMLQLVSFTWCSMRHVYWRQSSLLDADSRSLAYIRSVLSSSVSVVFTARCTV